MCWDELNNRQEMSKNFRACFAHRDKKFKKHQTFLNGPEMVNSPYTTLKFSWFNSIYIISIDSPLYNKQLLSWKTTVL